VTEIGRTFSGDELVKALEHIDALGSEHALEHATGEQLAQQLVAVGLDPLGAIAAAIEWVSNEEFDADIATEDQARARLAGALLEGVAAGLLLARSRRDA